jgi:hypothetical protein
MKRYYVCDIIGDGSQENAYRPSVALESVNWAAVMPANDPVTGAPVKPWSLVVVGAKNHAPLGAKPGIDPLPALELDAVLPELSRASLRGRLQARGIRQDIADRNAMREVVRGLGREIEPAFDESTFDVLDDN